MALRKVVAKAVQLVDLMAVLLDTRTVALKVGWWDWRMVAMLVVVMACALVGRLVVETAVVLVDW